MLICFARDQIAAREGRFDVCKLLLDAGADPLAESNSNQTPLHAVTFWASTLTFGRRRPAWDICRLLLRHGAIDTLIDDVSVIAHRNAPIALLRYLQQQMYPSYHEIPFDQRFALVKLIRSGGYHNTPDLIRLVLGSHLNEQVVTYQDSALRILLHYVARRCAFGDLTSNTGWFPHDSDDRYDAIAWRRPFDPGNHKHPWRVLLRDIVSAGSPLHSVDRHGRTPLCTLIRESFVSYSEHYLWRFRYLSRMLNAWLIELHASEVDLQKYGEREMARHLLHNINRPISRNAGVSRRQLLSRCILFSYGPKPEDWHFWFREPTDKFAGQFWAMLQESTFHPSSRVWDSQRPIPGSWVESGSDADPDLEYDSNTSYESDDDENTDHGYDPDFDKQSVSHFNQSEIRRILEGASALPICARLIQELQEHRTI